MKELKQGMIKKQEVKKAAVKVVKPAKNVKNSMCCSTCGIIS